MPILIDELSIEIEGSGVPETPPGPASELTTLTPEQLELAALMDLIDERRARLVVD